MILRRQKSAGLLCVAAALCFASTALAQDAQPPKAKGDVSDALPDMVELDPFGGVSLFGQINQGLGEKLDRGGTGGGRVTFNISRWVGLELSYNFSGNNVTLLTPIRAGLPSYTFGQQSHQLSLDPVINFRPRGSRVVPYVSFGPGLMRFIPTKQALDYATNPAVAAIYQSGFLKQDQEVAFNYGGGVKIHVSRYFGVRLDVRGVTLPRNPTFGAPSGSFGGLYIVPKNVMTGIDATFGVEFYIGRHVVPVPPVIPVVVPALIPGDITGADGTLCQGKPITLHSTATDPANHALKYTWKLNGAPQSAEGPDFSFTPNNAGDFKVEVTVVDTTDPKRTVTAGPRTVTVLDYMPPQITSVTATPATLTCSAVPDGVHQAALAGAATGSACGGALTYKWTVSEGSVTNDTSANATFDGSNLNFESGGQSQSKTITATFTATDATGKSVSGAATITVNCPPQYKRLPDIVFSKNNARVNNCGKRILIDQAAPQAGSAYDILLVAHRSPDEKETLSPARKGRKAAPAVTLDEQRALNAAAVLMNDSKTCASVDATQVKIDVEGTDQVSTPDPGICGTSTLPPAQKERKGSAVTDADKERRVEVYLVPKGSSANPPAAKNVKPAPETVVKGLGCPK
jgi:hypothetical protein